LLGIEQDQVRVEADIDCTLGCESVDTSRGSGEQFHESLDAQAATANKGCEGGRHARLDPGKAVWHGPYIMPMAAFLGQVVAGVVRGHGVDLPPGRAIQ